MTRTVPALAAGLLTASLAVGCSWLGSGAEDREAASGVTRWDPSVSMTAAGERLAASAGLAESAPTYDVDADVEPESGHVSGTVRMSLPVGAADVVRLRYFAGVPDFDANAKAGPAEVDGEPARATRDAALVTVPLPEGHRDRVDLSLPFSYTLPMSRGGGGLLDALGGMGGPADIGLLSRHENAWNLGHWFPLWIPEGGSADPEPAGFGDIGNSPAALVRLRLAVPRGWDVVDGGVRTDDQRTDDTVTVTSEGYGMNDLVVSLTRDYVTEERTLDGPLAGVVVRAHGPAAGRDQLAGVLDETAMSLEVLSDHFADYPWRELDVVSAPLGSGVAGMEWPGATWIEPALFTGGIPGLGGLEDLLGGTGGDLGGLVGGDAGRMLQTLRAWTIAHEVGHEWWHVIVGNDSVLAPVVDEPLAQYSACLVLRELEPGTRRVLDALCDTHIRAGYEQMRMLGDTDAPAGQSTDSFDTSLQYAGVVYSKAAAFYRALEERLGRETVAAALGEVSEQHAFDMLTADELRDALSAALDDPGFDRMWRRWIEGTHGDEDLAVEPGAGSLEGLGGLGTLGGDAADLDALLEQLLGRADPNT